MNQGYLVNMGMGYCKIGDYEFRLKKSVCGFDVIPVAVVERPSGQIEIFYQHTGATQTLTRIVTRDRGVTQTQTNYTLKDENNANVTSGLLTMPICSLTFVSSINTYLLVYHYNGKVLMAKGTLNVSDVITWAQPTIVVSNVTVARPHIIHNTDGSLDVYYKTMNDDLVEILKVKRSRDYRITWTDIEYDPTGEISKENIKLFNLPECAKVGLMHHNGQNLVHDYLTHTVDGKIALTENIGNTGQVPTQDPPLVPIVVTAQTPAVLRSRTEEYYIAYTSGIGLTLSFARSRDAGITWSEV